MRLANGIVIDKEATFGALKFSALRREVHLQNEDGSVSEVRERKQESFCGKNIKKRFAFPIRRLRKTTAFREILMHL